MTSVSAKQQRHLRRLITFRHKFGSDKSNAEDTKFSANRARSKSPLPRPTKKSFSEMTLSDFLSADDNESASPIHSSSPSSTKSTFSATPDEAMRQVNQARNRLIRPRAARGERTRHFTVGHRAAITRNVMNAMRKIGRTVTSEEKSTSGGRQDRSGASFYQRQQQDVPLERPKASHGRPKASNVARIPSDMRDLPPLPRPCW